MAQGRPLSRHGRYDALVGMQMTEPDNSELYRKSDYPMPNYANSRPQSGYKNRGQAKVGHQYDQYARVTTPREEIQPRPVSRRGADSHREETHMSLEESDESQASTPPTPRSINLDSSHSRAAAVPDRPPSSARKSVSGGRPMSASHRIRSARNYSIDSEPTNVPYIPDQDMPELSARPPSSFSKYRLLPAIGTPTPPDYGEDNVNQRQTSYHSNHLYNVISDPGQAKPRPYQASNSRGAVSHGGLQEPSAHHRISSAVSDISVISTRVGSRSQPSQAEVNQTSELVERLDLSKLDGELEEPPAAVSRRRKSSGAGSVSSAKVLSKAKTGQYQNNPRRGNPDPGDLYDGDDDDSDSTSAFTSCPGDTSSQSSEKRFEQTLSSPPQSVRRPLQKAVVVIPSPDHPAVKEILLAVKLPTDGTRHQRYFRPDECLAAVVAFAEEVAGEDFGGYILVSSAPKHVYSDLDDTIEAAGLEDKTVLHLEEND